MILIREIPSRLDYRGWNERWGLFLCFFCLNEVERRLHCGKRDKSCGCKRYELMSKTNTKHGESKEKTKLYKVWCGIKQRCNNSNSTRYKDYGGRGITICPEWAESYIIFRNWALNNGYQEGLEIDRIDNNGNYGPNNCRWVTRTENQRNKRNNKLTIEKANKIREKYKTGDFTQYDLKVEYTTDLKTINQIIHNKLWTR